MIARRRLREPDVTGIAGELSALERANDGIAIADLAARGVHEVGAALHLRDQCIVAQALRLRGPRGVYRARGTRWAGETSGPVPSRGPRAAGAGRCNAA